MSFVSQLSKQFNSFRETAFKSQGLKAKVFRGGAWLTTGSVVEQGFRFGRSMILARLLAPEAFGTMAVIVSATSIIHSITDIGVSTALIQHPSGTEEEYKSAAWWLAFSKACSLYLFFFLVAPLLGKFYGNSELIPLLRVATLGVLFDGAFSPNAYIAQKKMEFRKWAVVSNGGGIVGIILAVVLSYFIRDVWALVLGGIGESVARFWFSYVVCPYLPRFLWNREAFRDLLQFSRGLFGLSFLNLIFARTDVFVLAKLYSAADLGLYVMAVYLVQTPANYIMGILGNVLMPMFSLVQADNARVNRILFQVSEILVLIGLPSFFFVLFSGRSVLTLVLGSRYGAATGPFIVAACVALVNIVNGQITTVFYARGLPQLHRRSVTIMSILMVAFIYPFVKWFGIVGGQLACLICIVVGYAFQLERIYRITGFDLYRFSRVIAVSSAISIAVIAIFFGTRFFPFLGRPVPNILVGILACVVAYILCAVYLVRNKQKVLA